MTGQPTPSKLYYTIGEVSQMLGENAPTLRYWEKEFRWLRPVKNSRGDRRYSEADIDLLRQIQQLTRRDGYTIEGAREQLKRLRHTPSDDTTVPLTDSLRALREVLVSLAAELGD